MCTQELYNTDHDNRIGIQTLKQTSKSPQQKAKKQAGAELGQAEVKLEVIVSYSQFTVNFMSKKNEI